LINKFKTIKKLARNFTLTLATLIISSQAALAQQPADWVNPFIGTTNYGATFPGPVVPFGMVSIVPYNVAPLPKETNTPTPTTGAQILIVYNNRNDDGLHPCQSERSGLP
jgi:putative alpha-1,2-mannosidase